MPIKFQKNYQKRVAMRALYPSFIQEVWDYFVYFISVFIVVALVYAFMRFAIFNSIKISGFSMYPYHKTDDIIYIDLFSKYFGNFQRGDIIVLQSPATCSNNNDLYIKRIIGLPGETVIFENGQVFILNDKISSKPVKLNESSYLASNVLTYKSIGTPVEGKEGVETRFEEKKLGENEYYFMGDNRTGSVDSRKCGSISKSQILGKEFYRFDTDKKSSFSQLPIYNIPSQF